MTATIPDDVTASDRIATKATKAKKNGESQAFPGEYAAMTLREYLAAKAMQGLLAAPDTDDMTANEIAEAAVVNADALLAELAK